MFRNLMLCVKLFVVLVCTGLNVTHAQELFPTPSNVSSDLIYVDPGNVSVQLDGPRCEADDFTRQQLRQAPLRPFFMQRHHVTQKDWRLAFGLDADLGECDACPVVLVSWYGAAAYANYMSRQEGLAECYVLRRCSTPITRKLSCQSVETVPECRGYRLPQEREWVYAVRASRDDVCQASETHKVWNWVAASNAILISTTSPRNTTSALGFRGFFDTAWEWTDDVYPPPKGSNAADGVALERVGVGGKSLKSASHLRARVPTRFTAATLRYPYHPSYSGSIVGFRLARWLE